MTLTFESFENARTRILSFGGAIEVLEPLALRMSVADFAQQKPPAAAIEVEGCQGHPHGVSPSGGGSAAALLHALEGRHHGFSNVRDTLEELHKGMSKAYPCGAGLGLMGVSASGDVALCHRFAGSEAHALGSVQTGIDRAVQLKFLDRHHIDRKTDCHSYWARRLCAGGCYHEAHTRYGDTGRPNLHYCEWIRGWTDTCLRIYGELAIRNPTFLQQFDEKEAYATSDAR